MHIELLAALRQKGDPDPWRTFSEIKRRARCYRKRLHDPRYLAQSAFTHATRRYVAEVTAWLESRGIPSLKVQPPISNGLQHALFLDGKLIIYINGEPYDALST
jgi:hypothetical protein